MSDIAAVVASILKLKVFQGNGADRRILIGDFAEYQFERNQRLTTLVWFNNSIDAFQVFLGKTLIQTPPSSLRGYDIYLFADSALGWNLNNNFVVGGNYISIATTRKFNDGRWHQAVGTYDASSNANGLRLYADGALEPSFIIRNALTATILNNGPLMLGDQSINLDGPFACRMGDCALYAAELNAAQVALTYGRGSPPRLNSPAFTAAMGALSVPPVANLAPVGYWRPALSDVAPLVTDEMGLHNGTAINMTQADYVTRK